MILDSGKTRAGRVQKVRMFESVVILDSGKTNGSLLADEILFESVVILDSGKTCPLMHTGR